MLTTYILLIVSTILIYLSSEYFVNGIEWVGLHYKVSKNATGTILAALGTALPETAITFMAVFFGKTLEDKNIGVGAAIGGPLVLATLGYAMIGLCFLICNKKSQSKWLTNTTILRLSYNQSWFIPVFMAQLLLGLYSFPLKYVFGFGLIFVYVYYLKLEMKGSDDPEHLDFIEPLKIRPYDKHPSKHYILLQTGISLLVMLVSSHVFVDQLEHLAPKWGIPGQTFALFLSPIATELPEIINVMIWVRQGKHLLALGNISGSMMIQTTLPSALGLLFTPWILDNASILSSSITLLAIVSLFFLLRKSALTSKRMALFFLFYLLFFVGAYFID